MIIWEYIYCVYTKESLVYTQEISCACTTLLCMLWARDPRGQGPKKGAGPVPGPGPRLFWVPGPWGPRPRACTRVLCMHKRSLVYTQEILLCTRNKCILTLSYFLIILIIIYPLVQHISLTTYNPSVVLTYILLLHIVHPSFQHIFLLHRIHPWF